MKQTSEEVTIMLDAPDLYPHLQKMMELVDRVFCIYKETTPAKSRASIQVVQKVGGLDPA